MSLTHRVPDSPYYRYGESTTICNTDAGSCQLPVSVTLTVTGVSNRSHISTESWRLTESPIRGIVNSPYHRYAESPTPLVTDRGRQQLSTTKMQGSCRLPLSPMRGVTITVTDVSNSRDINTESRWLTISPRGSCQLLVSPKHGFLTPQHQNRELSTPCITDVGSPRLTVSPMPWVKTYLNH